MKKIIILFFILSISFSNAFWDEISFQYPKLWDLERYISHWISWHNLIAPDSLSAREYCISKWMSYISNSQKDKEYWKVAIFNGPLKKWELSESDSFLRIIMCDDWIDTNSWTVVRQINSWNQDINFNWVLSNSDNTFMTKEELFSFYQLEFTWILLFTIIIIVKRYSFYRKNDKIIL